MIAVCGGELSPVVTGLIYCSVIGACQNNTLERLCSFCARTVRWLSLDRLLRLEKSNALFGYIYFVTMLTKELSPTERVQPCFIEPIQVAVT